MVRAVHQGKRLSDVLPECRYLPSFVTQLLRAGETSGELPRMCEVISRHYSRETKHMAKTSSTIIEPLLIAGLTGVVLLIALAVFLPMWDMVSLMG
jgi:type II secretory pathway component PulF